jgi:hypothetical protein
LHRLGFFENLENLLLHVLKVQIESLSEFTFIGVSLASRDLTRVSRRDSRGPILRPFDASVIFGVGDFAFAEIFVGVELRLDLIKEC